MEREFRSIPVVMETRKEKNEDGTERLIARGYASTFDEYLLFDDGDTKYFESIDRNAFDECDFSDCVFRKDHMGTVFARTSNGTLNVFIDDHGLGDEADLSKTAAARQMHEEIASGMYPQQSFAFIVSEDAIEKDKDKNWHRRIKKISKCYDVSPVTWPANPFTDISARSLFDGAIEKDAEECRKREELELAKEKLRTKLKIGGI